MAQSVPAPRSLALPLLLALVVAAVLCAAQLSRGPAGISRLPLFDYTAFWAAGRLTLTGADPYDPQQLAVLQREADPHPGDTLVMWPAPWALTVLLPFSHADAHVSHLRWLVFEFLVLLAGLYGAWRAYGGKPDDVWRAGLVAFTFLPTYCVLATGQMGLLILLGFVGFLYFLRRGQEGLAGAALVLAAIKPQLTLLFWVALLLWSVSNRRWKLILGGILGTVAALAWPMGHDPQLLNQYWLAITQRTQTHSHLSPLIGTALRLVFGREKFWLQFVPMVPGVGWVVWYWLRHRQNWIWTERLPALLFASFLTASYGAWPFDLVVLLLPLLQRTAALQNAPRQTVAFAAIWFAAVNLLALSLFLAEVEYFWFLWLTPAVWLGYAMVGGWLIRDGRGEKLAKVSDLDDRGYELAGDGFRLGMGTSYSERLLATETPFNSCGRSVPHLLGRTQGL